MRDSTQRRPGAVTEGDDGPGGTGFGGDGFGGAGTGPGHLGTDVRFGADTDTDGRPDTLLTVDGADLLVLTDLDDDGLADRVLRLGPDGSVHGDGRVALAAAPPGPPAAAPAPDPYAEDPDAEGPDPAALPGHGLWPALLGRLLGTGW